MNLRRIFKEVGCDKATHTYDSIYQNRIKDGMSILEVGVFEGRSVEAWLKAYPSSLITVIDTFERVKPNHLSVLSEDRVSVIQGDSTTVQVEGLFDIIIDDGCHTHRSQIDTFKSLSKYCKGRYFIEDVWPFDKMKELDKLHPWIRGKEGWSDQLYKELQQTLLPYNREYHDLRHASGLPDSYLIEIVMHENLH